jgi:hypothetical protein
VPGPWRRRVWAWPVLTALGRPAEQAKHRRHQPRIEWGRHMVPQVRRWQPGRRLGLAGEGGCAAVALALACVQSQVGLVSRWRWDAARYHPPGPPPPGKRGPNAVQGTRQRRVQAWASRSDTPWETVAVEWSGGPRKQWWVSSRPALWYTPGQPPVGIRDGLVAAPAGHLRLASCCCTALEATPVQMLAWVVRRWSVEVPVEAARAPLGFETQRQWADHALARTTPVRLGRFAPVTGRAWRLSREGHSPGQQTAGSRHMEPTVADGLALGRQPRWRAR